MKNIKNIALGLSIATLMSLAFPSISGTRISFDERPEKHQYASDQNDKSSQVQKLDYMAYQPDIYNPKFNFNSSSNMKHLENESPDAFSDKYIREFAKKYGKYHKLKNCEYMAKAYGNGRGFGDYLFIKGFSYFDQEKNSDGAMNGKYIVKCTHQEFDQYLQEMKTYYTCTKADDNPSDDLHYTFIFGNNWRKDEYKITYLISEQVLIEEQNIYEYY